MESSENPSSPSQSALLGTSKSCKQKGKEYELGLFIFLLTGISDSQHFDLGKEVNLTDKFDDVVARVRKEYTCLQAKLEDDPNAKLDPDVLIGRKQLHKGGFNLRKYYVSYLRIKEQLELNDKENTLKKLIIFTNTKLGNITIKGNDVELELASHDRTDINIKTRINAEHYKIKAATIGLKQYLTEYLKSDLEILSAELVKYFYSAHHFVYGKKSKDDPDSTLSEVVLKYYYQDLIKEGIIEKIPEKESKKEIVKFTEKFIKNDPPVSTSAKTLRSALINFIRENTYGKLFGEKLRYRFTVSQFPVFDERQVKDNKFDCPPSNLLLQAFSNYIIPAKKSITLDNDHFRYYHTALVNEKVIVIHDTKRKVEGNWKKVRIGKISETFIKLLKEDKSWLVRATNLRNSIKTAMYSHAEKLEGYFKKDCKIFPKIDVEKHKKEIELLKEPKNFEKYLRNVSFLVSNDFGQPKSCGLKIFLPNYKITENSMKDFVKLLEFRLNELNVKELFEKINNTNIRERFLEYYDFDPKHLEREIKDLVENWKNHGGANAEGWIVDSEKKKFVQKIETDICRPVAKYKTRKFKNDLNQKIDDFGLHFTDDASFQASHFPEDKNIFYIKTESVLLTSMKMLKFLNERGLEDYIFINVEKLEEKEKITRITKAFQDDELNLLILSYEAPLGNEVKQILYGDLLPILQNRKKRIFLITSTSKNLPFEDIENQFQKVSEAHTDTLSGFTNPSKILEQKVKFQGELKALSQLIDLDSLKLIDAKALDRICKNETITVGYKPFTTSDLPGAYTHLSEEVNKKTLLTYLSQNSSEVMFVISGIQYQDKGSATSKFIENLELPRKSKKRRRISILKKINVLTHPYSVPPLNEVIQIVDNKFEESNFKELCGIHSKNTMFWIKCDEKNFKLQEIYNPAFYMEREFFKVLVKTNFMEMLEQTKDQFVISGVAFVHLLKLGRNELVQGRVFLMHDTEAARIKFNDLNNTVHWLEFETENGHQQIVWRNSKGVVKNLRKYIDKDHPENSRKERELFPFLQDKQVVIFADDPGMGKSTTLVRLYESATGSNKILTSHWVINVNLREHLRAIRDIPSHDSSIDVIKIKQFLSEVSPNLNDNLPQNLLDYALCAQNNPKKPLLITFDGFDEILDEADRTKVLSLFTALKEKTCAKFWVTTRLQHQELLEDALSTFSVTFLPLDEPKQKSFIVRFYRDRLRLLLNESKFHEIFDNVCDETSMMSKYTDAFLEKMESVFVKDFRRFIGIPLQLDLLLGSKGSVKEFQNWAESSPDSVPNFNYLGQNVLEVYKNFLTGKYEIYSKRTGIIEETKQKYYFKQWISNCKCLAKSKFLPGSKNSVIDDQAMILAPGLIKPCGDSWEFIHPTFGEYFVSEIFFYWIEKDADLSNTKKQKKLVNSILINDSYHVIRSFINARLANKLQPLPEETLREYEIIIDEELGKEDFSFANQNKETPLHIAAREGNENIVAFLCSSVKSNEELLENFVGAQTIYGANALHFASEKGNDQIIKMLYKLFDGDVVFLRGLLKTLLGIPRRDFTASVNSLALKLGWTPLHLAVEKADIKTVEALLEPFSGNVAFLKELMYISEEGSLEFLHFSTRGSGWTPLHAAAEGGSDEIVEKLLQPFANDEKFLKNFIKISSNRLPTNGTLHPFMREGGWTFLQLAAENGYVNIIKKLITLFKNDTDFLEELKFSLPSRFRHFFIKDRREVA